MTQRNEVERARAPQDRRTASGTSTGRLVAASLIGTIFEFYDLILYATVSALLFAELYFPQQNEFVSTIFVWSAFAIGYLMRPIGAIIFGHIGDKIGRKRVLVVTLLIMGTVTVVIGVLPTYQQIGVAAPIVLVVLRLAQGVAAGGEHGSATVMLIEHKNKSRHRGFLAALPTAGSVVGALLATATIALLTSVTSDDQFQAWGWRIPFLASGVLLVLGYVVRRKVTEPEVMRDAMASGTIVRAPLFTLLRKYPKQMVLALAPPFVIFFTYYLALLVSVPYAASAGGSGKSFLLTMSTIGQIVYALAIAGFAAVSDKVGRRPPMLVGSILLAGWAFAFFPLLLSGNGFAVFLAFAGLFIAVGCIYGPVPAFLTECFGTEVRLTGMSVVYQVAGAIAGGFAPLIATSLLAAYHSWIPLAGLILIGCCATFVAAVLSKDSSRKDIAEVSVPD